MSKKAKKSKGANKQGVQPGVGLRPTADRVLIKLRQYQKVTAGGIILPDRVKSAIYQADVVAVGPDAEGVQVGDVVVVNSSDGTEVTIRKQEMMVVRRQSILGIVAE